MTLVLFFSLTLLSVAVLRQAARLVPIPTAPRYECARRSLCGCADYGRTAPRANCPECWGSGRVRV